MSNHPQPLSAREQILVAALQDVYRHCEYCDTTALRALVRADVATKEERAALAEVDAGVRP